MDGWNTFPFPFGFRPIFRGELAVSFREGTSTITSVSSSKGYPPRELPSISRKSAGWEKGIMFFLPEGYTSEASAKKTQIFTTCRKNSLLKKTKKKVGEIQLVLRLVGDSFLGPQKFTR